MSAEALGHELLSEVKEESLNEVCHIFLSLQIYTLSNVADITSYYDHCVLSSHHGRGTM